MPQDTTSRSSSRYPPDRSRRASRGQASDGASRFAPASTRTGEYYDSAPQYTSQPTTGMRPRMVAQTTGHTPIYPPMSSFAPPSSAYPVQSSSNVASSRDKYRRPGGSYTPTSQHMPRRFSEQASSGLGGPGSYAPQTIPTQAYEPAVQMPGSQPITVPSRLAGETPRRSQDSRGLPRPPTPGAPRRQGRRSLTPGAPLASRGGVDTRGTTTPTGSYDRRPSGPIAESGSNKSRSKLVIRNGAGTLTLFPGDTYSAAGGKTVHFSRNGIDYSTTEYGVTTWSEIPERDERATGTQLPPPPTPPPATATAASAATQRPPSAVRPRTPLQPAQSEFSSNDKVVEVGSLSPKSSGGNSMQTGGLATTDKDFAGRRPRSRSRNNRRATHDESYMATRSSGDALTSDPPGSSYPSHPEAKYDDGPPRDPQRSSYNSHQAKYDGAPSRVSGRGRTQDLPYRSQRLSKMNSRPPSRGRDASDESRHDYRPSARSRRGDPNTISVQVDEEYEEYKEYEDRRSRTPRAPHDGGTERVTMRTHTRTSGGQQQPGRSIDSREAVVGDDDPDAYYDTRFSGRSILPRRSLRDSRKPSSRKSQWDYY